MTIQRKFTANYHPQTNMTERVNRTLKPLIAIFAQEHPHSWDKEIQQLAFAIRTSVNETTGETPAFLMFGRDPVIPLDLIIGDPIQGLPSMTEEQEQIQNYKSYLMHNLRVAFDIVREHSEVEKLSQKMKYDRHTTVREFTTGDLVWVATTTAQIGDNSIRNKLQPKYQGLCRIIEQLAPSTFIVKRISDNVNLGATNADRLKIYYEPISDSQMDSTSNTNQPLIQDNPETTDLFDSQIDSSINMEQPFIQENADTTDLLDPQVESTIDLEQPLIQENAEAAELPQTTSTINNQVTRRRISNRQHRMPIRYQPYDNYTNNRDQLAIQNNPEVIDLPDSQVGPTANVDQSTTQDKTEAFHPQQIMPMSYNQVIGRRISNRQRRVSRRFQPYSTFTSNRDQSLTHNNQETPNSSQTTSTSNNQITGQRISNRQRGAPIRFQPYAR